MFARINVLTEYCSDNNPENFLIGKIFSGQPSFKQIASLLDKAEIAQIANDARSNRYVKKLKQNSQLKYFHGDSANAIEIQVWCWQSRAQAPPSLFG